MIMCVLTISDRNSVFVVVVLFKRCGLKLLRSEGEWLSEGHPRNTRWIKQLFSVEPRSTVTTWSSILCSKEEVIVPPLK